MEFNVKADVEQVRIALRRAHNEVVDKSAVSALNRVGSMVKSEAVRQVKAQRNLPVREIRHHVRQEKAWGKHLVTVIRGTGRSISLRTYGAHNTAHGVSVKVMPAHGRKIVHRHGNKAFIFSRGHRAPRGTATGPVMVRTGRSRLPIEKLYGPSIPTAFVKRVVMMAFRRLAEKKWPERFDHEVRYRLKRIGFDVEG